MSRGFRGLVLTFVLVSILSVFASFVTPAKTEAAAGINSQVSFNGKLVSSSGVNIADGTYNMEFKLYSGGTATGGGTLIWTEDRLISGSNGIVVSGGTFQINLGSVTALSSSLFNNDTLYLSMQVGSTSTCTVTTTFAANCAGDGEMSPFIRFTSTPYAMNADRVGGVALSGLVQLSPGSQQTGTVNVSGGITTGATIQAAGSITTGTTAAAGLLVLQDGTANNYKLTLAAQAMTSGSFTMNLPATGANGNQCLQSTSGSVWSNTSLYFAACSSGGAVSLQTAYNNGSTIAQTAAGSISLTMSSPNTADQLIIDNTASSGVTTAGVNGVSVKYKGGAAAVEAAGMRVDFTPGTTSGGIWSGMRIVEAVNPASGVTSYGLKLEGAATGTGGVSTAIGVASGWDIGVDIQSGGLQLASTTTDLTAPTGNNLKIYAKTVAGRVIPKWISSSGVDTQFQASLGFNRIAYATPNSTASCSTGFTALSTGITGAGTCSVPTLASTNLSTSVRRISTSSGTTAGTTAYTKSTAAIAWRGNAQGLGGFFFTQRFSFSTLQSGMRFYTGLVDGNPTPTNVDPSTSTTYGKLGVGINSNTGNLIMINNTSGATPAANDLGTNFPVNTTNLYELVLYSPPNGGTVGWRITNLSAQAAGTANSTVSGTFSTNLPASTSFLSPMFWVTNNATAAAAIVDNVGWYLESDN